MKNTARVTENKLNKVQQEELQQKLRKFPVDVSDGKLVHTPTSELWSTLETFASHKVTERHVRMMRKNPNLLSSISTVMLLDGFMPVTPEEVMAVELLGADNVILGPSFFSHLASVDRIRAPYHYYYESGWDFSRDNISDSELFRFRNVLKQCARENHYGSSRWVYCYLHRHSSVTPKKLCQTKLIFSEVLTEICKQEDENDWFTEQVPESGYYLLDFGVEKYVGMTTSEEQDEALAKTGSVRAPDQVVFIALALGVLSKHKHFMPPGNYHTGSLCGAFLHYIGLDQRGFIDVRFYVPHTLAQFVGTSGPGVVRMISLDKMKY